MSDAKDAPPVERLATHLPDFCERYDISLTTAYKLMRAGRLRVVRIGRKPLVLAADEAAFVERLQTEHVWAPTAPDSAYRAKGKRLVEDNRRKRAAQQAAA